VKKPGVSLKPGDSLKVSKKFKDLESASTASASRKSHVRKPSAGYTDDPCTPPRDTRTSDQPDSPSYKNSTELDRMLIADDDNYLNPQQETAPDSVRCESCYNQLYSFINSFRNYFKYFDLLSLDGCSYLCFR